MTITEIITEKRNGIAGMRSDGKTWGEVAEWIAQETGTTIPTDSLRKIFGNLSATKGGAKIPVPTSGGPERKERKPTIPAPVKAEKPVHEEPKNIDSDDPLQAIPVTDLDLAPPKPQPKKSDEEISSLQKIISERDIKISDLIKTINDKDAEINNLKNAEITLLKDVESFRTECAGIINNANQNNANMKNKLKRYYVILCAGLVLNLMAVGGISWIAFGNSEIKKIDSQIENSDVRPKLNFRMP